MSKTEDTKQGYPAERIDYAAEVPRQLAALMRFGATGLDPTVAHLVEMRASQINGCAFCLDMHWQDARAAGEDEARLYLLDAWRETKLYDERERAALALCEAITVLAPGGVPDAVWDEAAARFETVELAGLVCTIVSINAWNRMQITALAAPGHYRPGDFDARPAGEPAAGLDARAAAEPSVDPSPVAAGDGGVVR